VTSSTTTDEVTMNFGLFRVVSEDGKETFIITDTIQTAALIWSANNIPEGPASVSYQVFWWGELLPEEQRMNIDYWLEFGPEGIIEFDKDNGWSMSRAY
jgi:hypothetical protein